MIKTDKVIQREVMDELLWEPSLHAENIGVQVDRGIVTLTGKVGTCWEKTCAETSTQRVTGVKGVVMELSTDAATFNTRTDADIASAARNALGYVLPVLSDDVKIEVHKGAVTLSGTVEWRFQMLETQAVVARLAGVTNVVNHLSVRVRADKTVAKKDIEDALARQAQKESDGITVTVSGSEVTLSGAVHSWAERIAVSTAAWCAPGVTDVKDALVIR